MGFYVASIASNFFLSDSQNQRGLKNKELASILARMHSEQESFRKRNPDYWHIREEMIGNVEQELQTRMGGRSRQKVSGECKHHVKGSHPQKLVLIDVKERICLFKFGLVLVGSPI